MLLWCKEHLISLGISTDKWARTHTGFHHDGRDIYVFPCSGKTCWGNQGHLTGIETGGVQKAPLVKAQLHAVKWARKPIWTIQELSHYTCIMQYTHWMGPKRSITGAKPATSLWTQHGKSPASKRPFLSARPGSPVCRWVQTQIW